MCLIVKKGVEPVKLESDMVVWKVVLVARNVSYSTFYRCAFLYERGETYSVSIRQSCDVQPQIFDDDVWPQFKQELSEYVAKQQTKMRYLLDNDYITAYGQGFHFATSRERLSTALHIKLHYNRNASIERFVVPKGATIILDESGLGIADEIRWEPDNTQIKNQTT